MGLEPLDVKNKPGSGRMRLGRVLGSFNNRLPAFARTTRFRRWFFWSIGLFLFYTIFGFLILPLIVRAVAVKNLSRQFDREASIRQLRTNPFVLSITTRGLLIKDKDGEPFLSWDEFYANFQLSSFFGKPWVFKEIRATGPYARVQVNKDYTLNFSDLLKKFSADTSTSKPKAPSKPLFLKIDRFQISGARASVSDLTPKVPFHRMIGPVELTLTAFRTDPSSKNPYAFSGTTDSGERFTWNGYFFLDPIRSAGELSLEGVSLSKYAPLYQDLVRFEIRDGVASMQSAYNLVLSATNWVVTVTNAAFLLQGLKVGEPTNSENFFELDSLRVNGLSADATARTAEIAEVSVSGGRLSARRERDDTLNLLEVSQPAESVTNAPGGILFLLQAATNVFNMLLGSTNLWSATLDQLEVTNCAMWWEDLATTRPVRLDLDQVAVSGRRLSNVAGSNETANVSLRWNTNGSVRINVTAQVSPAAVDVDLSVHDLELRPLDPYLEPFVNLFIIGSKVNVNGRLSLKSGTNSLPEVGFIGDASLDDFATVDGIMAEDLVKWKSVGLTGMDAKLQPPTVAVKAMTMIEPYARVAIETNRVINLLAAMRLGETNAPSVSSNAPAVQVQGQTGKGGLSQKLGSVLRGLLESNTNSLGAAGMPKLSVEVLAISNAAVQFVDRSVQPAVSASITQVNGTIANISSEELRRADVNLNGTIDRTGPFEVTGKINPLAQNAPTELEMTLHNVDLSPGSPYSGKYLGYHLSRGKLNLQVKYSVSQRNLKAQNMVVLDQFTLGEKVTSPDATKLPVRLAVALLKDRNGKIELDLPIEGNLDDPQFHYGRIIMHVLGNIMTKLVTSPFAVLGALFGGKGEEVSYQDFPPGSSDLQPANLEKLQALIHGLEERPGLQLEIEGCSDPGADREALRRKKLERQLCVQKWNSLRKSEQARISPDQITLTPEERTSLLQRLYSAVISTNAETGGAANSSAASSRNGSATRSREYASASSGPEVEKGATALFQNTKAPDRPVSEVETTVLASINVTDDELGDLALKRSRQVQQSILGSGKIESERVFLAEAGATNKASRVYFHLR
jgi:hypothetical protein